MIIKYKATSEYTHPVTVTAAFIRIVRKRLLIYNLDDLHEIRNGYWICHVHIKEGQIWIGIIRCLCKDRVSHEQTVVVLGAQTVVHESFNMALGIPCRLFEIFGDTRHSLSHAFTITVLRAVEKRKNNPTDVIWQTIHHQFQ